MSNKSFLDVENAIRDLNIKCYPYTKEVSLIEYKTCFLNQGILNKSICLPCCQKTICKTCLNEWMQYQNQCPNCRQQLPKLENIIEEIIDSQMINLINQQIVFCCWKLDGCEWFGRFDQVKQHLKTHYQCKICLEPLTQQQYQIEQMSLQILNQDYLIAEKDNQIQQLNSQVAKLLDSIEEQNKIIKNNKIYKEVFDLKQKIEYLDQINQKLQMESELKLQNLQKQNENLQIYYENEIKKQEASNKDSQIILKKKIIEKSTFNNFLKQQEEIYRSFHQDFIEPVLDKILTDHKGWIWALAYINNGKNIISGGSDRLLRKWDLLTFNLIDSIETDSWIRSLCNMQTRFAVGLNNGIIQIYHSQEFSLLEKFQAHQGVVRCIILMPNMDICSGSDDKLIKVWNSEQNLQLYQTFKGHNENILCLMVLDEDKIVSGSLDETIKIWSLSIGACLDTLSGHSHSINQLLYLKEKTFASASTDNTIRIWRDGTCISTFQNNQPIFCLLKLPNKNIICGGTKLLKIWDYMNEECLQTIKAHSDNIWNIVFAQNKIITASNDSTIKIWNL